MGNTIPPLEKYRQESDMFLEMVLLKVYVFLVVFDKMASCSVWAPKVAAVMSPDWSDVSYLNREPVANTSRVMTRAAD